MERIIFRALIVLSALAVVVGLIVGFGGLHMAQKGRTDCEQLAIGDAQLASCRLIWPSLEAVKVEVKPRFPGVEVKPRFPGEPLINRAHGRIREGHLTAFFGPSFAILVSALLFLAFYILRWILTGRWRDAETE